MTSNRSGIQNHTSSFFPIRAIQNTKLTLPHHYLHQHSTRLHHVSSPDAPPDGINVNAIANPADYCIEALSSPTALFQINNSHDPSNLDSFLSQQCLPPVIADGRAKHKSNLPIATPPSSPKRRATSATRSSPCRSALCAVVRGVAGASRRDAANRSPGRVSPPSVLQSVFDIPPPSHIVPRSTSTSALASSTSNNERKKGRWNVEYRLQDGRRGNAAGRSVSCITARRPRDAADDSAES